MSFWIMAFAVGLLAALWIAWPLLQARAAQRNYGLALVLLIPVAALALYQTVGTPAGIGVSGTPGAPRPAAEHAGGMDIGSMVTKLERRLQDNPADSEGWLLLGRTYKTMQEYDLAEAALVRAAQLAPGEPTVLVELAEARLFTSRSPVVNDEVIAMLDQALEADPGQQKGLWLRGLAAAQAGDQALALQLWERLADQLEPGSPIMASLQQQIAQVRDRSGASAAGPAMAQAEQAHAGPAQEPGDAAEAVPAAAEPGAWKGMRVAVQAPEGLGGLPPTATLFVIVRNPAMPGPPLGVARINRPTFPAVAFISDANSMMQNRPISAASEVQVLARLSMSGTPTAQAGDLSSEPVTVGLATAAQVELALRSN